MEKYNIDGEHREHIT